ncbi:unnamed protein product [Cochlearia groenlandica]
MDSASPISNQSIHSTTSFTSDRSRRKRRKKSPPTSQPSSPSPSQSLQKWKSENHQQIYSTKLVRALRQLRITQSSSSPPSSSNPSGGRAVREVADRALAVAARGKTLWSRAILSKAVKLRFRKQKRQRRNSNSPAATGNNRSSKQRATVIMRLKSKKGMPAVQRKVKLLSRLVPGCRKQTLPVVLEETTDYIAAMEMQIRAMTAILSAVSSSPSPPSPPPGGDGGETHMLG